jgi:hypothetical protein
MTNKYEYLDEFDDLFDSISDANIKNGASMKLKWMEPEYYETMCNIRKEMWENPEHREMMSDIHKERWEDQEFREMMSDIHKERCKDSDIREKMSDSAKKLWDDSQFHKMMSDIHKERCKDSDIREKMSANAKKMWHNQEIVTKIMECRRKNGMYTDPEKSGNYKGAMIGTNIETGEEIILKGGKQIKAAGFSYGNIVSCLKGERKSHKGYTWRRETVEKE